MTYFNCWEQTDFNTIKVALDIEDDSRRAGIIREEIGWDVPL